MRLAEPLPGRQPNEQEEADQNCPLDRHPVLALGRVERHQAAESACASSSWLPVPMHEAFTGRRLEGMRIDPEEYREALHPSFQMEGWHPETA